MAHKDQKDDKKSKGKAKKSGTESVTTSAPMTSTEKKGSKLKPYPLPVTRKCSCVHPYQDQIYGKGMRLHNPAKKMTGLRCSVCGHDTN